MTAVPALDNMMGEVLLCDWYFNLEEHEDHTYATTGIGKFLHRIPYYRQFVIDAFKEFDALVAYMSQVIHHSSKASELLRADYLLFHERMALRTHLREPHVSPLFDAGQLFAKMFIEMIKFVYFDGEDSKQLAEKLPKRPRLLRGFDRVTYEQWKGIRFIGYGEHGFGHYEHREDYHRITKVWADSRFERDLAEELAFGNVTEKAVKNQVAEGIHKGNFEKKNFVGPNIDPELLSQRHRDSWALENNQVPILDLIKSNSSLALAQENTNAISHTEFLEITARKDVQNAYDFIEGVGGSGTTEDTIRQYALHNGLDPDGLLQNINKYSEYYTDPHFRSTLGDQLLEEPFRSNIDNTNAPFEHTVWPTGEFQGVDFNSIGPEGKGFLDLELKAWKFTIGGKVSYGNENGLSYEGKGQINFTDNISGQVNTNKEVSGSAKAGSIANEENLTNGVDKTHVSAGFYEYSVDSEGNMENSVQLNPIPKGFRTLSPVDANIKIGSQVNIERAAAEKIPAPLYNKIKHDEFYLEQLDAKEKILNERD